MPKIGKDALPVGEPLTCAHGTWTRPHVIRCMRCFPEAAPPETCPRCGHFECYANGCDHMDDTGRRCRCKGLAEAARCDETSHEWRYSLTSGGYVCATCGLEAFPIADEPEAAPPRATTPEPLTEDELAAIRRHHEARYTPNWMHSERLLREVDRLRSSEGAREAERLRAAVEAYVEAWEAKDFADCIEADDADTLALQQLRGREKARAFGALRASLRATPPETETEP